ncbi:hypothetical protein O3M35_001618 [Rhynocoris fuscipes]|uniref:Uncharacterized protein n=1 Tax=Rhynocoris fuscipes TaxID=488301 RepID=A0AAW1CUT7_9HEMI
MMLRRPWPPLYSAPLATAAAATAAVNYAPLPPPDYYYNKSREYYLLAPYYRDALPPPPPPPPRSRCPCACLMRRHRSRSLDTVTSEAFSDPEDQLYEVKKPPRPLYTSKRRSMEDLLDPQISRKLRKKRK